LENLQVAENTAMAAINAQGPLLINRLHDILACTQETALHGVRCGAAVALAAAQVQTRHDLLSMEPGFPMVDDPNMQEDLIEDFDDAAVAIEDTYQPKML
jgi:hypothetical protein